MTLSDLRAQGWPRGSGPWRIAYRTGPFLVDLQTDYRPLLVLLADLYPESEAPTGESIANFHVWLRRPWGIRRWRRPQIRFLLDTTSLFEPYPLDHAFPLLEWGLNWCIAMRSHQYLMLHAAAIERHGSALILPAMPGAGKSTLSAALALRGWRLLSDEFGLYRPQDGCLLPLPRAVPLKNESIRVIREFDPQAFLGPVFPQTRKGDVAHLRPPTDSLRRQREPALPRWVVFPRFQRGASLSLRPIWRSEAFTRLAGNSFNYHLLGGVGFRGLVDLIGQCECFSLIYGDLDEAVDCLGRLSAAAAAVSQP